MAPDSSEFPETAGLTKLGGRTPAVYDTPEASILEAFPNKRPGRDYRILFDYPEFTSLCPMTGQPDFGRIRLHYVPGALCLEAKSFKLYLGAFRNHGAFMETIVNTIADDLIAILAPRRLTLEGLFNVRGGTAISVRVDYLAPDLPPERKEALAGLWQ
jgi:7-cyano-7-deazaguanine reductase